MMEIRPSQRLCTVIVTLDAAPETMVELESHARDGLARFAKFDGFVAGALHKSADGTRLVQYLQWRDEAAHLAFMHDPIWHEIPSTRRFMDVVESGKASMKVGVFDVIAETE